MLLLIMKIVFSFLLKLNSHHPHTFTSALQQTLKQNHGASHNCNSVKTMLKLSAFKKLLNELLLETEWSEAVLMWWFVWIKFIRSFLKLFFLISLLKRFFVISTWLEELSCFHLQISCFPPFYSEKYHLLFL